MSGRNRLWWYAAILAAYYFWAQRQKRSTLPAPQVIVGPGGTLLTPPESNMLPGESPIYYAY